MSKAEMIKRSLTWQIKRRGPAVFAASVVLFALSYLCARNDAYQWEPKEMFSIYLGGSGSIDLMMLLWLFLHLPIRGFLWQVMRGECEQMERIRTLKYQSRSAVVITALLTIAVFTAIYYAAGFGLVWMMTGRVSGGNAALRALLASGETLSFVLLVFLLSRAGQKLQYAAFPAAVILELIFSMVCGSKGGVLRFLPFTQAKSALQGACFTDGTALVVSALFLAVLTAGTIIVWKKEDDGRILE